VLAKGKNQAGGGKKFCPSRADWKSERLQGDGRGDPTGGYESRREAGGNVRVLPRQFTSREKWITGKGLDRPKKKATSGGGRRGTKLGPAQSDLPEAPVHYRLRDRVNRGGEDRQGEALGFRRAHLGETGPERRFWCN